MLFRSSGEGWAEFAENVRRNRGESDRGISLRWMGVIAMMAALVVAGWCVWKFVLEGRLL